MAKTLLKHFTLIGQLQEEPATADMGRESIAELVNDLKHSLAQAERELLSPRPEVMQRLMQEALN